MNYNMGIVRCANVSEESDNFIFTSALKMEAEVSSETFLTYSQTTRYPIPEDHILKHS
jgi:hypothetical protein